MSEVSDDDINYEIGEDDLKSEMSQGVLDYLSDTELQPQVPEQRDPSGLFPNSIVVAGLPKVDEKKKKKLYGIFEKILEEKIGSSFSWTMDMPDGSTGFTCGMVIIDFNDPRPIQRAIKALDNLKLDNSHTFKAIRMDDVKSLFNLPERVPENDGAQRFSRKNFRNWMESGRGREQILLRYQDETEIHWHDPLSGGLEKVYAGEREKKNMKLWCDSQVKWSPHGSYLTTFHKQGIALWSNDKFEKQVRFAHDNVKDANYSPHEEYLMTWNGESPCIDGEPAAMNAVKFFHTLTGQEIRSFPTPSINPLPQEFPQFLWSYDGKYIAQANEKGLSVYEMPEMTIVRPPSKKKGSSTLDVEELSSFAWSPKDNLISVWVQEKANNPARLMIMKVPSLEEIASRSRTQCGAQMIWQSEGDYLCLVITKLSKSNKGKKGSSVEIFRIREKNCPVETVELKDLVKGFFWETRGKRFALITEPESGVGNPKLSFYSLAKEKCDVVASMELPSTAYNEVFWAPEGQYFIVASIPNGGDLLWGQLSAENRLEILYKDEHFMLNKVSWDPSSRYVLTACVQPMFSLGGSSYKYQMESGFSIWTFQGRLLVKTQKEKLWDVSWRPHPKSLLIEEETKSYREKMKTYSKKYDGEDEAGKDAIRKQQKSFRDEKIQEFNNVLNQIRRFMNADRKTTSWNEALQEFEKFSVWEVTTTTEDITLEEKRELIE